MTDHYLTIELESEEEIKIKNSRFIGRTFIVSTLDEMNEQLSAIRKREYNANHNCYAYIIGIDKNPQFKYSDDGEPGGTAGKPIYDFAKGSGATNLLVIITRYFGGTKLGTGGLVKAYGECAKLVLEKSGLKDNYITDKFSVILEFPLYNSLQQLINRIGAAQINADFSDRVFVQLEIRQTLSEKLLNEIRELSKGKAIIEKIN